MSNLDFGLADIPLASGDHLCVLYSGADERNAILGAYVSAGLAAGHRCLCVVEADDQPGLLAAVTDGRDAKGYVDSEQLEFVTAANSYLAGTSFSITDTLAMWTDRADLALDEGFSELRGAGDANGLVGHEETLTGFAAYDSELNHITIGRSLTILCLWDLQRFRGNVIADLLRTHRRMILGGRVIDSPYFIPPDEYLAERMRPTWVMLSDEERLVARQAARGLTTAEVAAAVSLPRSAVDRQLHRIYRTLNVASRSALVRIVTALGPEQ